MLDEADLMVLDVLSRNPRATVTEISRKTGLSRPTVRARLKKLLESGVIRGFRLELDEEKVGGKAFLLTLTAEDADSVVKELLDFGGVEEVFLSAGRPNVHVLLYAYDVESLNEFLKLVRRVDPLAELHPVISHYRVDKSIEKIIASGNTVVHCETCGSVIRGAPFTYTYGNKKHYFCCPVCRQVFIDRIRKN